MASLEFDVDNGVEGGVGEVGAFVCEFLESRYHLVLERRERQKDECMSE